MPSILKLITQKLINFISGEINVKSFWKTREQILKRKNRLLLPWYYIKYQRILVKSGAQIPLTAKFKGKIYFPHRLYGIFISAGASIGKECVIFQHVTIGSNTLVDSLSKGSPTIGNNCYIGAGAKIIGKVKIGNNVRIGANCVIVQDIPDNCTVVLNKPRIIRKKKNVNKWIPL